jgi:hypothetical protein
MMTGVPMSIVSKKTGKRRESVVLTAYWGNDDAESTIKVSPSKWHEIEQGGEYCTRGWGWYEGARFSVGWRFASTEFSIDGIDGAQCVLESPIVELIVQVAPN